MVVYAPNICKICKNVLIYKYELNLFHCKNLIIKCSLNISSVFYLLIVYNYFLLKFYEIIEFMFINVHFEVKWTSSVVVPKDIHFLLICISSNELIFSTFSISYFYVVTLVIQFAHLIRQKMYSSTWIKLDTFSYPDFVISLSGVLNQNWCKRASCQKNLISWQFMLQTLDWQFDMLHNIIILNFFLNIYIL